MYYIPVKVILYDTLIFILDSLKRHIMTHTGENHTSVNYVQLYLPRQELLKKHSIIHSDEKSYKYEVCSTTFSQTLVEKDML